MADVLGHSWDLLRRGWWATRYTDGHRSVGEARSKRGGASFRTVVWMAAFDPFRVLGLGARSV